MYLTNIDNNDCKNTINFSVVQDADKFKKMNSANKFERTPEKDTININFKEIEEQQKKEYIKNSPFLSEYERFNFEISKKDWAKDEKGIWLKDEKGNYYQKIIINAGTNVLKEANIEELKEIDKICSDIYNKTQHDQFGKINSHLLKNFVDLYYHHPELYEYAINSEKIREIYMDDIITVPDTIKDLSLATLKEIEKGRADGVIINYIVDSDILNNNPEKIQALHDILATNKTEGNMTVYRGEKDAGQFDIIPIKQTLSKKIKFTNFIHQYSTKKETYQTYDMHYHDRPVSTTSIYEYIKNKKELSLADAMLMMQHMDKYSQKEIIELIKNSNIDGNDGRFKSTSLSEKFTEHWVKNGENNTTIIDKYNLKEGCEGYYVQSVKGEYGQEYSGGNSQCEFLLNNNPRKMTIKDVTYDNSTDEYGNKANTFCIEYDVEPI